MTTALLASSPASAHPSGLRCPPRWATPRTWSRPTLGPKVGEIAQLLGQPLMPWQQHVADVALELDPATGMPVYREVGLTVPRQQGKTLLILAVMVQRALGFAVARARRQNIVYTAQTGSAARTKFQDDHLPILATSKLKGRYRTRLTNGHEALVFDNRSKIGIAATTEKAVHGETLDMGIIDEAFAHQDDRLEQAFKPAMLTRQDAQLWWLSTAGKDTSYYLLGKVEAGRGAVNAGLTRGVAFFEWSADPKADPGDPATWWSCMPALGYTVQESTVAADYLTMREKPQEWRRGYLNLADSEAGGWELIPKSDWEAACDPESMPQDPVAFAVACNNDRTWASIGVAGRRADGLRHVEVVDRRPGTGWVVARMKDLADAWRPCAVVLASSGPAAFLISDLEKADIAVKKASQQDYQRACGGLYVGIAGIPYRDDDGKEVDPRDVRHRVKPEHAADDPLTIAVRAAQKKTIGDTWTFERDGDVDSSPLESVACALWGYSTTPPAQQFFGSWR